MITNAAFTLSNVTPTQVVQQSTLPQEVHMHNASKSSNNFVFIGKSDVSSSTGLHLDPGGSKVLKLMPGDALWAVSDPSEIVLQVLTIRQN